MEEKNQVDKLFNAYLKFQHIDEDTFSELLKCLDIDYDDPDSWPFENWNHDHYDYSFELHNVTVGYVPSEIQIERCWELGFARCWLNYKDGTKKYYYKEG